MHFGPVGKNDIINTTWDFTWILVTFFLFYSISYMFSNQYLEMIFKEGKQAGKKLTLKKYVGDIDK